MLPIEDPKPFPPQKPEKQRRFSVERVGKNTLFMGSIFLIFYLCFSFFQHSRSSDFPRERWWELGGFIGFMLLKNLIYVQAVIPFCSFLVAFLLELRVMLRHKCYPSRQEIGFSVLLLVFIGLPAYYQWPLFLSFLFFSPQ